MKLSMRCKWPDCRRYVTLPSSDLLCRVHRKITALQVRLAADRALAALAKSENGKGAV